MTLLVRGHSASSIFRLYGVNENSASAALAWGLEKSPEFRKRILTAILGEPVDVEKSRSFCSGTTRNIAAIPTSSYAWTAFFMSSSKPSADTVSDRGSARALRGSPQEGCRSRKASDIAERRAWRRGARFATDQRQRRIGHPSFLGGCSRICGPGCRRRM